MLKYNLKSLVGKLTAASYNDKINEICKLLGVSRQSFNLYMKIKADDKFEIRTSHLLKLKKYFKLENIEELFTEDYLNQAA